MWNQQVLFIVLHNLDNFHNSFFKHFKISILQPVRLQSTIFQPLHPGYYLVLWGVNVSCLRAKHWRSHPRPLELESDIITIRLSYSRHFSSF